TPILQNYSEATKLLADAGWKDSDNDGVLDKMIGGIKEDFKFDMNIYAGIPDWNDLSLMLAAELKKAGIVMTIVPLEVPVFLEKARTHDFDMLMSVWTTNVSPDDFTQLWHTSSWSENGDNYSGFGNNTSDALIDSIKYTVDDSLRTAMDKRFQKMVVDDMAYIFLFNSQRRIAVHKRFGNVNLYFEKPGLLLNTFRLLSPVNKTSATE
ncbi:MAG TPA: ABC transporter substrate-binding protein, partial [Bacteroidia bacterium]|nr:ABC transporter substrate-binding protein [Bacteroidia bacterium]